MISVSIKHEIRIIAINVIQCSNNRDFQKIDLKMLVFANFISEGIPSEGANFRNDPQIFKH